MIPDERQDKIIYILKDKKFIKTEKLSKKLYVSQATIRRDLNFMEKKGLIKRVKGGAILISEPKHPPYDYTSTVNVDEKNHIANLAIKFIKNGQKIFIDPSTTAYKIIDKLSPFSNLTFLTYGIHTASKLCELNNTEVYMMGGKIDKSYLCTSGVSAYKDVRIHYSNIAFISCRGFSSKGAYESDENESYIKKEFSKNTECLVLLVDSSKFNLTHFNLSVCIEDIDIIITDKKPPNNIIQIAKENEIEIIY